MLSELNLFEVTSTPATSPDLEQFIESMDGTPFAILFDFERNATLLGIKASASEDRLASIKMSMPGISFSPRCEDVKLDGASTRILSIYRNFTKPSLPVFKDLFYNHLDAQYMTLLFYPANAKELEYAKTFAERTLSSKHVRETHSMQENALIGRFTRSLQYDSILDAEETSMLNGIIASLSDAMLSTSTAYKIFAAFPNSACRFRNRIAKKFLILSEHEIMASSTSEVLSKAGSFRSFAFGPSYSQNFINFFGEHRVSHPIQTEMPLPAAGNVSLGTFMLDGVTETARRINIEKSSLNLGFMVSGLPGTGKTMFTMSVADSILLCNGTESPQGQGTNIVVITSTNEWRSFASAHNMHLVRICEDKIPINFFRVPSKISPEKFYEDLAAVLSSASKAGPYSDPMQKCMLRAFRSVYKDDVLPDPVHVYNEIERAVIELHAKRIGAGAKLTKHGENILSSLEELRDVLSKPEFSMRNGVYIEDLLAKGVVFDISAASTNVRPYFYALILNAIYAIISNFDENGDKELRALLCIEEAQTIFGDRDSAAVQDIKARIQDFRKQGVGLMLIVHNANDIDPSIRRLCQNKLYLRQAPDVAAIAAKDMIFSEVEEPEVSQKLKLLDSRVGMLSCITRNGNEALVHGAILIKTPDYRTSKNAIVSSLMDSYIKLHGITCAEQSKTIIKAILKRDVAAPQRKMPAPARLTISQLGIDISSMPIVEEGATTELSIVHGECYKASTYSAAGRLLQELEFKACSEVSFIIADGNLRII